MLPVLLVEPDSTGKKRRFSKTLTAPKSAQHPSFEYIRKQLREIRDYSLAHLDALLNELTANLAAYPEVEVSIAKDAEQAVETIKEISDGTSIAINKSALADKELMPTLIMSGVHVIETYYAQFEPFENRFIKAWQLPTIEIEPLLDSFGKSTNLGTLREASVQKRGSKNFTGLLGVSAVSAKEAAILLLQHAHNVSEVFQQAKNLILIASLDKIVENLDDAIFQTTCMAIFGCGVLPLSLHGKPNHEDNISSLPFEVPPEQTSRKIHLIIFDNGRSQLLHSRYMDLLACIGCRACTKSCPAFPFFEGGSPWSPKEYIYFFATGKNPSLNLCLQCRSCQADCPLNIDLPGMILDARIEAVAKGWRSLADSFLSNFETVAKWGSSIPLLADMATNSRLMRWLGEKILDISKERQLPKFQRMTFAKWSRLAAGKNVDEI